MILEEFDYDKDAILNPAHFMELQIIANGLKGKMPKVGVSCFERKGFNRILELLDCKEIAVSKNANDDFPIYVANYKGKEIALFLMDMGAAGAGGQLEEVYALGVETVIVFGSCGVLDRNIEDCEIIIPNSAVRDEGLSYHYVPASDEIAVNLKYIPEFTAILDEVKVGYRIGKTWTTDAIYRETRAKMERRKEMGCICVEMECSAMAAVAQFREKEFFQFLFAADNLDAKEWDRRSLGEEVKFEEKDMFAQLALELAVRIL